MAEKLILAFDTSAAHCGAVLLLGQEVVAHQHEEMARGQAERLFPLLEEVLAQGHADWADLGAVGVGIGPGNFTGIRISVAAARGLALSLEIPAIGVSTLEALAFGASGEVVASVAGGRSGLYVQRNSDAPLHCTPESLPPIPERTSPLCIGDMAEEIARHYGGTPAAAKFPLVEAMARIALSRCNAPYGSPVPLYLKAADAAPSRDAAPVILP